MTDYLYFAIRLFACVVDIGLLYMWLSMFSRKRNYNRVITAAVFIVSAITLSYVNHIENVILSIALQLLCFALVSVILFEGRIKLLMFYTVINYVISMAVELLFGVSALSSGTIPFMLAESVVKFIVYLGIMRVCYAGAVSCKSSEISAYMNMECKRIHYIVFYSVPVISGGLLMGGFILWDKGFIEHSPVSYGLMTAAAAGLIIMNAAVIYFFDDFAVMAARNRKIELADTTSKLEWKYYADLEAMHGRYDVYLHDIRHTMRTIAALAKEGKCEEIKQIIEDMSIKLGNIDEQIVCSHKILNALFSERKAYAKDNGVTLGINVSEPLILQEIDNLDLVALMGNLLDNAIEAEIHAPHKEGITCDMHIAGGGRHIVIQVENSYERNWSSRAKAVNAQKRTSRLKTSNTRKRIGEKHGIGLISSQEVVRKYGGIFENNQSGGRYKVKIILPMQRGWEDEEVYTKPVSTYVEPAFK